MNIFRVGVDICSVVVADSVDGNVFPSGGFRLAPHRLGVVDVAAELVKVEDVEVVGRLDQVD